jgi:hypothetical protein
VNADTNARAWIGMKHADDTPVDLDVYFSTAAQIRGERFQRFRLERPAKRRLDDDFYISVARAYADAVFAGLNPRKTLALDSDTPADTVARWIREARRRRHLSPGEPGKAAGVVPLPEGGDDGE